MIYVECVIICLRYGINCCGCLKQIIWVVVYLWGVQQWFVLPGDAGHSLGRLQGTGNWNKSCLSFMELWLRKCRAVDRKGLLPLINELHFSRFKACNDFVFYQEYTCNFSAWRRYDMGMLSSLPTLCEGKPSVTDVMLSIGAFYIVSLEKLLNIQSSYGAQGISLLMVCLHVG